MKMIKWPWASRKKYDDLEVQCWALEYGIECLQSENTVLWKKVNNDTQTKRKKEEAAKPRDSKGRYAKKCK